MSGESFEVEEEVEEIDTSDMELFEVPSNIDFTLNSYINNLYYDNLEIKEIKGKIYIRNSRVVMENLSMNMLEGYIKLSGEYNSQDINNPLIDFSFQAKILNFPQ